MAARTGVKGVVCPRTSAPRLLIEAGAFLGLLTETVMHPILGSIVGISRPEAMADVPGVCELPLTRAVVQYRDVHEVDLPGGRIQDIGLALVLEGRYAASAEVIDLGSTDVKVLDLSSELVVLDWVYEPTLGHVNELLRTRASSEGGDFPELKRYCFDMALRVLGRVGFGPLTRASLLRIGFRDICRDLDLHEGTSVRIKVGASSLARAVLDYDANALVFRTSAIEPDVALEAAILDAFPRNEILRATTATEGPEISYHVRLPFPVSLGEARRELTNIRRGLARLLARYEPERFRAVEQQLGTFGASETLAQITVRDSEIRTVALRATVGPKITVH
jgi:hypothetical protein